MKRKHYRNLMIGAALAVFLIATLFPIYWMLITSLKTNREVFTMVPTFWPGKPSVIAYRELLIEKGFIKNILNSLNVSTVVAVVSTLISMFAAYAITKLKFKGQRQILKGVFYSYLMPRSLMFIPLYMLTSSLGLSNTIFALYLVYPTITIPYGTWMLVSYFKSVPYSLEEAAIIDGCSKLGSMWRIVFPLALPGIFSVLIVSFSLCWSEYLYSFILISNDAKKTLTVFLSDLIVDDMIPWASIMGGAIIASIPAIILYYLSSSFVVSGVTSGGVKE